MSPAPEYLSRRPLELSVNEPVLVAVVRNETLRLPYFLTYYRTLGFRQFLIIDNASDDGTREFLLKQQDVFAFGTDQSFSESGFGMGWVNPILDRYCDQHWILLVDVDELLVWPRSEQQNIMDLINQVRSHGSEGLFTVLLDMYSDAPFGTVGYTVGTSPLSVCSFFDRAPYTLAPLDYFPYAQIYGGVRARLFAAIKAQFHPPTASKVPLVRWQRGQGFILSAHALARPLALAPMRGALLHFKMLDDLPEKCVVEVRRAEHYANAREYAAISEAIEQTRGSFFDEQISLRYEGSEQLVALGIMNEREPFPYQ